MDTKEFFDLVLPSEAAGYRLLGYLPKGSKHFRHTVHITNEGAAIAVGNQASSNEHIYHALGAYRTDEGVFRKAKYVTALRSFWMDLDVKPGVAKHYQSREDALTAVKGFCTEYHLPKPVVVGSGRYGVHIYWPLDADIPVSVWKPRAETLKALAQTYGLLADHGVTADVARVLRPVGAYNLKLGRDKVELLSQARVFNSADVFALIDAAATANIDPLSIPGARPDNADSLPTNTEAKFEDLPVSLVKVAGQCNLLASSLESGGVNDSEVIWYALCGFAGYTDNPEDAITQLAGKHPDFSLQKSLSKMSQWKSKTTGPATCRKLQEAYGSQCETCPHNGKITSPIALGRYVPEADAPVVTSVEFGVQDLEIPNPPKPFQRGKDRGIYYSVEDASGATTPVQICPTDLFPIRIQESEKYQEQNVVWRSTQPHGKERDILLSSKTHFIEASRLLGELAAKGVIVQPKNAKIMQEYMVGYIRELHTASPVGMLYTAMGWKEDGSFVAPHGICTDKGFVEFPSTAPFAREARGLVSKGGKPEVSGTVEGWVGFMKFYNDDHYIPLQLGFLLMASSPLMRFTNVKGVHVNLVGESGCGKSTIGFAVNSLWGHPTEFGMNGSMAHGLTSNALFHHAAIRNNISLVLDEVTNWKGAAASDIVYTLSQGRGKERMKGADGFVDSEFWQQISGSSSNQSLYGKIAAAKKDADAELLRVIEYWVPKAPSGTKSEADNMIRQMNQNYGVAGPVMMDFIVKNRRAVEKKLHTTMAELEGLLQADARERYWTAGLACALVQLSVLRHLKMLTWDYQAIFDFAVELVKNSRSMVVSEGTGAGCLFSTLLDAHSKDTMVVEGAVTSSAPDAIELPVMRHTGQLLIRKELSTNCLYVASSLIKKYCDTNGVDQKRMLDELLALGAITEADTKARKVLGANTIDRGGQVRCWKINWKLLK